MDELVRTAPGAMERAGNGVRHVFEVLGVALLALVMLAAFDLARIFQGRPVRLGQRRRLRHPDAAVHRLPGHQGAVRRAAE